MAEEFLKPLNAGKVRPESTTSVAQFIETEYLPWTERSKRPSTVKGYRDIWNLHIKARIGDVTLRDFRPADGTRLHTSLATTQAIYIKVIQSDVQAAMNKLASASAAQAKRPN